MFYVYANGQSIFNPLDEEMILLAPQLSQELGKSGSFQFQIPPSNRFYDQMDPLRTIIVVEYDDAEVFRGRVLTNSRTFNNIRTIYCEGFLSYLVDSVLKDFKYTGTAHAPASPTS